MSSQKAPPPPNYAPIAAAASEQTALSREIAQEQLAISREHLAWAKETYTQDNALTDRIVEDFLRVSATNEATAAKDRARYEDIYQPLEDSLAEEAADYSSPERREMEMGRAVAGVDQQFEAARQAAIRNLEGFGINPGSTRYAALDIGVRAQAAAAKAAAANQAGQAVDATGRALRSEAINVGRGYPGQIAGQYGTALQAGNSSGALNLNTTASGANTMGTGAQWGGLSNQSSGVGVSALGAWGNTLNTGYQNQMAQFKANQEASSGWGSALGLVAGAGLGFMGLPTASVGGKLLGFNEGGAVEVDGGAVPSQVSPSGGKAVDDVPARVSVGEFIVPTDVVNWYGQKHFYKLIEKADEEREGMKQQTGAVPDVKSVPRQQAVQV